MGLAASVTLRLALEWNAIGIKSVAAVWIWPGMVGHAAAAADKTCHCRPASTMTDMAPTSANLLQPMQHISTTYTQTFWSSGGAPTASPCITSTTQPAASSSHPPPASKKLQSSCQHLLEAAGTGRKLPGSCQPPGIGPQGARGTRAAAAQQQQRRRRQCHMASGCQRAAAVARGNRRDCRIRTHRGTMPASTRCRRGRPSSSKGRGVR